MSIVRELYRLACQSYGHEATVPDFDIIELGAS